MNMAMLMCETLVLVLKKEAKPKYCGGRFVEYKWSDPVSDAHKPAQDWGRTNFFRVEVAKLVCSNILWFGILCCSFLVPGVTPLPECFMGIVAFWESIAVFLLVMCSSGQRRGIQHPAGLILVGLLVTIAFMWLVLSVTAFKPAGTVPWPRIAMLCYGGVAAFSYVVLATTVLAIYWLGRPNHAGNATDGESTDEKGAAGVAPFTADYLEWSDLLPPWSEEDRAVTMEANSADRPVKRALLMSACPGRCRGTKLRRSLPDDLAVAKGQFAVSRVVTLMPKEQLVEANVADIEQEAVAAGMDWDGSLAWRDKWLPSFSSIEEVVAQADMVLCQLRSSEKVVLVHCFGGKGRTGLLVVAILLAAGATLPEAVFAIRKSRKGTIMNPLQLLYLQWVAHHLNMRRRSGLYVSDSAEPPLAA
mmetsp:Transcript_41714/g.96464  ORF Transcript_41714/g.96464 Transcript_41714/m.96464 type:complete len:417 (-) Transcript_41714:149-1399(-)